MGGAGTELAVVEAVAETWSVEGVPDSREGVESVLEQPDNTIRAAASVKARTYVVIIGGSPPSDVKRPVMLAGTAKSYGTQPAFGEIATHPPRRDRGITLEATPTRAAIRPTTTRPRFPGTVDTGGGPARY